MPINKEELKRGYLYEKKTIEMLAKEFGVNKETIWKRLKEFNILSRRPGLQSGQKLSLFHREQISKAKKGNRNPAWKGGRVVNKGYVFLLRPGHPGADIQGYVAEHRFVMEEILGRLLLPTEVVHHINGITDDNRKENLMLFSSAGKHRQYHKKSKPLIQEWPK